MDRLAKYRIRLSDREHRKFRPVMISINDWAPVIDSVGKHNYASVNRRVFDNAKSQRKILCAVHKLTGKRVPAVMTYLSYRDIALTIAGPHSQFVVCTPEDFSQLELLNVDEEHKSFSRVRY